MKAALRIVIPLVIFVMASALAYFALAKWNSARAPVAQTQAAGAKKEAQGTIDGVQGLSRGEVVALPQLRRLNGDTVSLDKINESHLLVVFFSTRCEGCARDAELWKDLTREASQRAVAFYLISVGDEPAAMEKFIAAYELSDVPYFTMLISALDLISKLGLCHSTSC